MAWAMPIGAFAAKTMPPAAIPMTIGGGTVDSTAFRWASALSQVLSRPPGLPDCDPGTACGVANVVASAQSYDDSRLLLKALIDGQVSTAVLPAIPVFETLCRPGKGPVPALSILKQLYRQPLYIVVRAGPKAIARPAEWAGKTIVTGPAGSDSDILTNALIDAYAVPRARLKLSKLPIAQAVAAVKNGPAAAGVFIGHIYDLAITDLTGHGFTLMSLPQSPERDRLLRALPVLEESAIAPGTFPGVTAISTVAQPVSWVAGPALDVGLTEKMVRAVSEPHNLALLEGGVQPVPVIPEALAFRRLPGPPASGARTFALSAKLPVDSVVCPAPAR
jgi:TRAP-type uncharacterized transport system substrate-binding protein